jgi:predicted alpha/beta hydrolase family esterase
VLRWLERGENLVGKTVLGLAVGIFLVAGTARAQDKTPVPPPPKPADDSANPGIVVLLLESSIRHQDWLAKDVPSWGNDFSSILRAQDWVALVTFSLKPELILDFTQNKGQVLDAILHLPTSTYAEANLFDALLDTVNRVKSLRGKASILIIGTGQDTFSKVSYQEAIRQIKDAGVTVVAMGTARLLNAYLQNHGALERDATFGVEQGEAHLRGFAQTTGGTAWFPKFEDEIPGVLQEIAGASGMNAPPPRPADEGPSLEVTMKFIQEKLKERGEVKYSSSTSTGLKFEPAFNEVTADPKTCHLRLLSVSHFDKDYRWESSLSFHDVEKIEVILFADDQNGIHVDEGHPEIQETIVPARYRTKIFMVTGKVAHETWSATARGETAASPEIHDLKIKRIDMPDEDSANRLAKAMVHAVELCGGGNKDPF